MLMTAFADEGDHYERSFLAGWPGRLENALQVAERVHALASRLAEIGPSYGQLWPLMESRRLRPSDPGPVLEMSTEELGRLIDRRGRFDLPALPAPVGEEGYSFSLVGYGDPSAPRTHGVAVRAGAYRASADNEVRLTFGNTCPIWRDAEQALRVLHGLVDTFDASWATAFAFIAEPDGGGRDRPWLAWTAAPLTPRPAPPFLRTYPYPFPFSGEAPPSVVRPDHGGELKLWD